MDRRFKSISCLVKLTVFRDNSWRPLGCQFAESRVVTLSELSTCWGLHGENSMLLRGDPPSLR